MQHIVLLHLQLLVSILIITLLMVSVQIKLGADSSIKGMEAELAKARKQIASVESMYKKEKASWVSELESKELEVG